MGSEVLLTKTWVPADRKFAYGAEGDINVDTHEIVATGPIAGVLTLDGGTQYDVTDDYIGVRKEHVAELCEKIHASHIAEGRYLIPFDAVDPSTYVNDPTGGGIYPAEVEQSEA
jgi:hypothetical protein